MIRVYVFKDGQKQISRLIIAGHSGYAQRGQDIVCAAVSGAAGVLISGFDKDPYLKGCYKVRQAGTYMCFTMPRLAGDASQIRAEALLDSFYRFIKGLQRQYNNYITVLEREVR